MLTVVLVFVDVVSVGTVGNSDLTGVSEVRVCMPVVIMSESVRSRMAAHGWVTRASRKLDEFCNVRDIDNLELRDAIEELDKRLETLDNAQSVVELELTVEQFEEDIIVASEFRDKARVPRMRATKMMAARVPARASSEQDSVSVVSASVEAKLPKLELPTFSGDVTEWTSFWDQFHAVVHASELPDITKFSYLRSLLKGEAKAAVQGLSLTAAHYRIACDLLRDRFGRPERIVFSHIQELLNITVPKYPNVSVLWKLYDDLQAHIRSLAAMGITGEQYGVVLTPLILSRLPPDLRMESQGPANKYISLRDRRSRREDTFFGAKFSIRFFRYYIKFLNKENMHTYSYGVLLYSDGRMPPLVALFADLYQFCTKYVLVTLESARRMC